MILIICENNRTSKTVALAMGAETENATGIYASDTITVATIPAKFIRQIPLEEMTVEYPFIPEKFKMAVTMKQLERKLKPLFHDATEVVFASDGGADAQARFFNICRHFRVGCPRSRMWLSRLSYGAIRGAFHFRETGRHLHRLAQTGLVSKGMDILFSYNITRALSNNWNAGFRLSRHQVMALEYLAEITNPANESDKPRSGYSVQLNVNSQDCYESTSIWEDQQEAEAVLADIPPGSSVEGKITVTETTAYNLRFHTLLTLQMDAYNNLGFLPDQTARVAYSLYTKGLISSPMTACSHLPAYLRGHLETVFGETNGYPWCDNGATLNNHAIITLRATEKGMTSEEYQLYWLIFNRMKAVVEQVPTRKYATIEFTVGNTEFSRQWELTGEAYEVTEPGVFDTTVKIEDAGVYPCDVPATKSNSLSDILSCLYAKSELVDKTIGADIPYSREINDWGSVIGSLVRDGLVSLDNGKLNLTEFGGYASEPFAGGEYSETLLTWQTEANCIYGGDTTGRAVIEGFSNSLLRM
ncbi:DNA topoisomerase, partial [uncultured Duncaniella sp.]